MHHTIIAAVVALLAGITIGTQFTPESPNSSGAPKPSDDVAAADFVSLRPALDNLPAETLTDEEIADLYFMREEEKLARDVYTTLYDQWQLPIFANIAQSEQTHTEAIRSVIEKYELNDPVVDDTIGVFQDETLADLFTSLTSQGSASVEAALIVGATIEDLDIVDLQKAQERTDNADIALVYSNLERGSRNHLRAFVSQLSARDATYEPQYLSTEAYEAIITSERETGTGAGEGTQGARGGRGWGGRSF